MARLLIFLLCICFSFISQAQTSETIVSSRPGQAFAPQVTGTGVFQVQSGFLTGESDFGVISPVDVDIFIHNTLFRYGISESFEVRASLTAENNRITGPQINSTDQKGISDLAVGMRYVLLDGSNSAGKMALQADIGLPLRTGTFSGNDNFSYQLLLIQTYSVFTENLTLNVNLGLVSPALNATPEGKYVVNFSHPVGDKLSAFLEHYGFISDGRVNAFYDGGFAYLINKDIQLDLSAGFGNNGEGETETSFWFADAGISFRL